MPELSLKCPLCLGDETGLFSTRSDSGLGERRYFGCEECGLVFLDPEKRLNNAEEKKRYDLHRNSPEDAGYVDFLNRLAVPLSERLAAGACGLDFGCGPGPAMSGLMRARGFASEDYDPLYRPDTALLNQSYDFITCTEVAEHLFQPGEVFVLLDRLLKPGGFLGVMTGLLEEEQDFEAWWYAKDPTHVSFYRRRSLEWIAKKHHWQVNYPASNVVFFHKNGIQAV